MNCPMNLPVYEDGTERCRLRVEREGLYLRFACRCDLHGGGMRRVYGIDGLQIVPLGLLMPQDGAFVLDGKRSAHSFPLKELTCAVIGTAPEPELLPWRGEIDGVSIERSWLRPTPEGYDLYIPQAEPFPLPADLSRAEPTTAGEIPCLRVHLDLTGQPIRPAESKE